MKYLQFTNGDKIPQLGLGTWKSSDEEVKDAVIAAIKAGYRHIDCAPIYNNEKAIGEAFAYCFENGLVSRKELFVTSKLWNNAHAKEDVVPAIKKTLDDLNLNYLDLFLIHWPVAFQAEVVFPSAPNEFVSLEDAPLTQTWQGMIEAKEAGLTKHIGVSNFSTKKLEQLLMAFPEHKVEMNQVELHPYLQQNEVFKFCQEHSILVTGYSPLGSGDRPESNKKDNEPSLLNNETVLAIAQEEKATAGQVLLSWHLHRGTVVIPKSTNEQRIKENLAAVDLMLTASQLERIEALNQNYRFVDGSFFTPEGSPYTLDNLWDNENY